MNTLILISALLFSASSINNDLIGTWVLPSGTTFKIEKQRFGSPMLVVSFKTKGDGVLFMPLTLKKSKATPRIRIVTLNGLMFEGELSGSKDALEGTCSTLGEKEACTITRQSRK